MASIASRAGCVGWRVALVLLSILLCSVAGGADSYFPQPLHLTRRIDDPIAKMTIEVEEYCVGNRVITVRGDRVVIVDYDQQLITDIDHDDQTYSITRFDEIARENRLEASRDPAVPQAPRSAAIVNLGRGRSASNREVERYSIATSEAEVTLSVDHAVPVGRPALDVLLGAAYPHRAPAHHADLVRAAMRPAAGRVKSDVAAVDTFGLPTEQATTWQVEGQAVTLRSVITRVGDELPPPTILSIPPGARRVDSRAMTVPRFVEELDRGVPSSNP